MVARQKDQARRLESATGIEQYPSGLSASWVLKKIVRSGPIQFFVGSMNTNERCDHATEQDQADVARRAMRNAGLAFRISRIHRGGHGASGIRCLVRRLAARHR